MLWKAGIRMLPCLSVQSCSFYDTVGEFRSGRLGGDARRETPLQTEVPDRVPGILRPDRRFRQQCRSIASPRVVPTDIAVGSDRSVWFIRFRGISDWAGSGAASSRNSRSPWKTPERVASRWRKTGPPDAQMYQMPLSMYGAILFWCSWLSENPTTTSARLIPPLIPPIQASTPLCSPSRSRTLR